VFFSTHWQRTKEQMSDVKEKFRTETKKPEVKKPAIMIGSNSFVSSSILTSEDGMFGDKFKEEEIERAPGDVSRDIGANSGDMRPLFEQLADQKEKQQEEFDAVMHSHRCQAPPPLDEEEANFMNSKLEEQREIENKRKRKDDEEAAMFQLAQHSKSQGIVRQAPSIKIHRPSNGEGEPANTKLKSLGPTAVLKVKKRKKKKLGSQDDKKKEKKEPQSALTSLLGSYGGSYSNSDSD
jgi:hypothetical protein